MSMIFLRLHGKASLRTRTSLALLLAALLPAPAFASPLLRCQVTYAGATKVIEFAPLADPYSVEGINIYGRFRFKAVVVGDERHIDYVSLYTYYESARQPVLLHQAKYTAPVASQAPGTTALTGEQRVYSPDLERELQYACAVYEVAP